jgi:putative methionine-R-sulfoxide reductase with GAF domain
MWGYFGSFDGLFSILDINLARTVCGAVLVISKRAV